MCIGDGYKRGGAQGHFVALAAGAGWGGESQTRPCDPPYRSTVWAAYSSGLMEITWLALSGCMLTP